MALWKDAPIKTLIYFALFGAGTYEGKMVRIPKTEREVSVEGLLDYYLQHAQKQFQQHCTEHPILESDWLLDFIKWDRTIGKMERYLRTPNKAKGSRSIFLDQLHGEMQNYTALDTRWVRVVEETVLHRYFSLLVGIMQKTMTGMYCAKLPLGMPPLEPRRDAEAEADWRGKGEARYLEALQSQVMYQSLIEEFLMLGGREDWNRTDLLQYPESVWRSHYEMQLLRDEFLYAYGSRTVREWKEALTGPAWELESAYYLMRRMHGKDNSEISEGVKAHVIAYYNRTAETTGFVLKPIADRQDGPNWHGMQVDMLLSFAERFSLPLSEEQARALLFLCPYPPQAGASWLPDCYLTKEQIRQTVVFDIAKGIASDVILGWHIRYCMDYGILECQKPIEKLIHSTTRRVWLRQLAAEYSSKMMSVEKACCEVLPKLQGGMFFYVVERYYHMDDERLAAVICRYGEEYPQHRLRCDIMLMHMQKLRGIEGFLHHIERRHSIPPECREYGVLEAIRGLDHPEVLDALGRFFRLGLRDSFRDEPNHGVLEAASDALIRVYREQEYERDTVFGIFTDALEQYGEVLWKKEHILHCMACVSSFLPADE